MSKTESTPAAAVAAPSPTGKTGSRIAIIAVGSAMFMQFIDSTALSTALPTLAKEFHSSPVDLRLVLTTYIVVQALFLPASGWAADRFGARRVFMSAMIVFVLGSIFSGLSHSLTQLVAGRVVQGLGGAMMIPVGRAIVIGSSPREQLIEAMMWLSLPAMAGPILGPPMAGFILAVASWPWIFFVNIPVGIVALFAIFKVVPKITRPHPGKFDGVGFCFAILTIASVMSIVEAAGRDWRVQVLGAVIAAPAGWAYVRHAKRREAEGGRPVLDLSLLRFTTYRTSMTGGSLIRLGVGGTPYLLALLLQVGLGWTPLQSGMVTIGSAAGALMSRPFAPRIIRAVGFKRMLLVSAVVIAIVSAMPALFRPTTPAWMMIGLLMFTGFARASQFSSANALSYADVPDDRVSAASTLSSVVQQINMSLGITLAGLLLQISRSFHPGGLRLSDFALPFIAIGLLTIASLPSYMSLPANAGEGMSGKRRR